MKRFKFSEFSDTIKSRFTWTPRLELPEWRWARNFTWISQTPFEKRAVFLRNKNKEKLLSQLAIDTERNQTEFKPNRFKSSKYSLVTFLPLNLIEQFRRVANFYFLVTLILTWIIDSPISPESWLLSLLFVIVVTMIKQGYEDYLRHKEDERANKRIVTVVRKKRLTEIRSEQVEVGDMLYLGEDQEVPCDAIVLNTSHTQGQCYVMTANLDGETSLKTRVSASLTKQARDVSTLSSMFGCIECENPNPKLDSFLGRLTVWSCKEGDEPEACSLSNDNLLLAGTVLKNTGHVFACCVYAGTQTKISLNSKITKNKFSTLERSLNKYLIVMVVILMVEMTTSTILSFTFDHEFRKGTDTYLFSLSRMFRFFGADRDAFLNMTNIQRPGHRENLPSLLGYEVDQGYPLAPYIRNKRVWYLDELQEITFVRILEMFLLWMVLYNYIIPLSMYVSLELQKFIASKQFQWDRQLYDPERNQAAISHTSDINEELGLVTHLFSDKTGTITRNEMILKMFVNNGRVHCVEDPLDLKYDKMMMILCLCHSVQVTNKQFVASSPDEKAILEFCKSKGFVFEGETDDGRVEVTARGVTHSYRRLSELQFDSYRKCMSVIMKDIDEKIHVLSKGAETTMLEACVSGVTGDREKTEQQITSFASLGLRTLVLGHKVISEDHFTAFSNALESSSQSLALNRAKFVREVYTGMEQELDLVGVTGIEDRLQEAVVQTIRDLRLARIKVWMLTGDKKETAINLGYSAGLLTQDRTLIDLCDNSDPRDVTTLIGELVEGGGPGPGSGDPLTSPSLVIDGKSVSSLYKDQESWDRLKLLAKRCDTVIACRLSPIQKSQLVRMVKKCDPNNLTAAIGDGGNDVSMLQEAHIGLGIIGHEGTAAAQASDFAFTKFKYLRRALLVHGHWYYIRASFLIQYSFYKNIAFCTAQFFFMFFSNYSANSVFESYFLVMYNTLYTFLPVLVYSITEQNIPPDQLIEQPKLYTRNRSNALMSHWCLFRWTSLALWHSLVTFFVQYFTWTGAETDLWSLQMSLAQSIVIVVNCKLLLESRYWNLPLILSVIFSYLCFILLTVVTQVFPQDNFLTDNTYYMIYVSLCGNLSFWASNLLSVIISLAPDLALLTLSHTSWRRKPKHNTTVPYIEPNL